MSRGFKHIPILDWKIYQEGQKPAFLEQLRDALIFAGFLYLQHPPIEAGLIERVKEYLPKLFALPAETKHKLDMVNSPHFLGYSSLGSELTKGKVDQREQFDFGTPYDCVWKEGDPEYRKLWGQSQWPSEEDLPGFKDTLTRYLSQVQDLSEIFTHLVAEALGLGPNGLDIFFDHPMSSMQHRSKVVKYPPVGDEQQGVGPHFDSGFLTLLLQASSHRGLQAQNVDGDWIDVPPLDDTLVVNIGKGLEFVTQRVALATTHRVLNPPLGSTDRYSVPYFQIIKQDIKLADSDIDFSPEILALRDKRGDPVSDSVNYSEYGTEESGHVSLIGRIRSHPDVARRHYPTLYKVYFPGESQ